MKATGQISVNEPFAGLFTQGMVNHESYRSADNRWLYPDEVEKRGDGTAVLRASGEPVIVGRVEAMSKSRRNTIDPGAIIARYGADTARWFILSDNPPDRDMEWTEARCRRGVPVHPARVPLGRGAGWGPRRNDAGRVRFGRPRTAARNA